LKFFPRSLARTGVAEFGLADMGDGPHLAILTATTDASLLQQFEGTHSSHDGHTLVLGPLSPRNAAAYFGRAG
jgi:hypothetical protein